jgi:hypothetical protein
MNVNERQRPRLHLLWPSFQKTAVISIRPLNSNGPLSSLTVTDFDPLAPFVLFSFGDVKVIVIRRRRFGKLIFRALDRHCNSVYESEQVLQGKAAILREHHTQVGHLDRITEIKL